MRALRTGASSFTGTALLFVLALVASAVAGGTGLWLVDRPGEAAQSHPNLILNGSFDSDVSNWAYEGAELVWSPDHGGSGFLTNSLQYLYDNAAYRTQCQAVDPSQPYRLMGSWMLPGGQPPVIGVGVSSGLYGGPDCDGSAYLGRPAEIATGSTVVGGWVSRSQVFYLNPAAVSIKLYLFVDKVASVPPGSPGPVSAHFDDVRLSAVHVLQLPGTARDR